MFLYIAKPLVDFDMLNSKGVEPLLFSKERVLQSGWPEHFFT